MTKEKLLERERRWARPVALCALGTAGLFLIAALLGASTDVADADTDDEFLTAFEGSAGTQLAVALLQAAGFALLAVPLLYLFQAAAARSDRMRSSLIGITVAGPLFLAVTWLTRWVAFDAAADEFMMMPAGEPGVSPDQHAENLIEGQTAFGITQGLNFAGTLGVIFGVAYTALYAMRVGLLSRFWGTLGMALAVSVLLLGTLGILVFVIAMGLLIGGLWPGGRPPAWEAGVAMPWPKGGAEPPAPPPEEEPGLPERFGEEPSGFERPTVNGDGDGPPRKRKRRR
jgi:hypothetical protein